MRHSFSENGSVMMYLFLAVILFAAVSFAVGNIMRSGDPTTIGKETAKSYATDIMQSASAVRRAVQTVKIEGYDETEISFENNFIAGYANAACGDTDCLIFHPDGGGVSYVTPNDNWLDSGQATQTHYGDYVFVGLNDVVGVGTTAPDLVLIIPWLKKLVCTTINDQLGITNPNDDAPADTGNVDMSTIFTGTFTASQSLGYTGGGGDTALQNLPAGCFQGGGSPASGTYHFYQVLLAR